MARSVNKVTLLGNIGKDAELRYAPSGTGVLNVSVATSRSWKKGDEWEEETEWHRVTLFGEQAERLAPELVKGKQVYVEGRIQTNKWTDKDGVTHYDKNIIADFVIPTGPKSGGAAPAEEAASGSYDDDEDGSMPF